jgi:hypothetical protein
MSVKLIHKHIPETTLTVSDEVAESMKGSWDQADKPKTSKPAAQSKK